MRKKTLYLQRNKNKHYIQFIQNHSRKNRKKLKVLVTQSSLILCDPVGYSPSGSSIHGILQARILEWVAIPFSRGSSQPRDPTRVPFIAGRYFTVRDTWEAHEQNGVTYLKCWEKNNSWVICFPCGTSGKESSCHCRRHITPPSVLDSPSKQKIRNDEAEHNNKINQLDIIDIYGLFHCNNRTHSNQVHMEHSPR